MVLMIAILQLMRLRMIQVVATAAGGKEVRSSGRDVVALTVLLGRWKFRVHHNGSCGQMMTASCLLMLVMMISTAGGWIHQERAHVCVDFSFDDARSRSQSLVTRWPMINDDHGMFSEFVRLFVNVPRINL